MARHPAKEIPERILRMLHYNPRVAAYMSWRDADDWRHAPYDVGHEWPSDLLMRVTGSTAISRDKNDAAFWLRQYTHGEYDIARRVEYVGKRQKNYYCIVRTRALLGSPNSRERQTAPVPADQAALFSQPLTARDTWPS